jgi:hypothetical protein
VLPFTADEFFAVFRAYNETVWPMQWALYAVALAAIALALSSGIASKDRWISALLAFLWAWMAASYHLAQFARINPAAYVFAVLFFAEALMLGSWSVSGRSLKLSFRWDARSLSAAGMLVYALIVYPALNVVLDHRYPDSPTFGVPCPTTIFTLGLLTASRESRTRQLLIIPILWSFIGGSAAFLLEVPQDLGLLISGAIGCIVLGAAWRRARR